MRLERYSAEMAEQSREEQRKLAFLEDELLENDNDVEICEADLKEAEKQLDEVPMPIVVQQSGNKFCAKCNAEFVPEFGATCEVNSNHVYCLICVYQALCKQASCPSGKHCMKKTEMAAWRFSTEFKKKTCDMYFMMDLLPEESRQWLMAGNETNLVQSLGMSLGEYL